METETSTTLPWIIIPEWLVIRGAAGSNYHNETCKHNQVSKVRPEVIQGWAKAPSRADIPVDLELHHSDLYRLFTRTEDLHVSFESIFLSEPPWAP